MDFSAIKTLITQNIRTNNNEDITGSVLQQVLLGIIETLGDDAINDLVTAIDAEGVQIQNIRQTLQNLQNGGYLYGGVAVPETSPGTPLVSTFFIATQAGTYNYFIDQNNNPITIGYDALYILTYEALENHYWECQKVCDMGDGVYDISANHNGATYADLVAALGTNGANVPEGIRKGGMRIQFVKSSDNKYVQYRLMNQNWSTTISDWQGVDDEPTAGSENLVKSSGVAEEVPNLMFGGFSKRVSYPMSGLTKTYLVCYLSLHTGHKYRAIVNDEGTLITSGFAIRKEYESDTDTLMSATVDGTQGTITREFTVNAEKENYVLVLYQTGSATITGTNTAYIYIEDITVASKSVEEDNLADVLADKIGSYGANIDLHPKTEVSAYIKADNGATKDVATQTLTIPYGSSGNLSDIGVGLYSLSTGKRNCMILHFKLLSGNWNDLVLQRNVQFFKQIELSASERILYVYSDYAQDLTTMYCYFRRTSSSTLDHEVSIQAVHIYKWAYSLTDISSNQELYNEVLIENISKGLQGNVDATFLTSQLNDLIGSYGLNIDLHPKEEKSAAMSAKNGATKDETTQTLTIPSGSSGYQSWIGMQEEVLTNGMRNCVLLHVKLLSGNWSDMFLQLNASYNKVINLSETERIYYLYRDYVGDGLRLFFFFQRTNESALDHNVSLQILHVYKWKYSLTDISSNQNLYIDSLKKAISSEVSFNVKKDGTGDFATFRAALDAAKKYTNAGKFVTINLSADTYELTDEYTTDELADTSFFGWPIGNNLNIIGDENGTILSGNLTDAVASQSREGSGATNIGGFVATIDIVSTNCLLQNLEVRGYNVRYCVHDDRSAAGSIHKLKNCKFIRYNSTYGFKAAYGAGCRANSKFVAEQCVFITEMPSATAFSMHDNVSFYKPASIVLKGCTFIGNGEYDVEVISQGHGLSIRNTAWFENCTFNTFGLCVKESAYAVSPYYDWEVSGTNNNGFYQISQIAADTDVHIVNFFDEIKICTTSSTLHTGSPVILTSNNVCGMAHSSAWGKIAGIVLGVVDGKVYVKTKGDIPKSMLGISGNVPTGRFYKVSANDYVVTTADDWYLLCKTPNVLTIR